MSTLVLYYNTNSYYFPYVSDSSLDCQPVYRKINLITTFLHKIPFLAYLSYGEWKYQVDKYDKVIIFDNAFDRNIASYLKKKAKKIYVYSWNTAITPLQKDKLKNIKNYFSVYSFDKNNCAELELNYAPMVYSRDIVNLFEIASPIYTYDVLFMGWDKGRSEELKKIYFKTKELGANCFFLIRGIKKDFEADDFKYTNRGLEYEEYLKLLINSKVLIDIQKDGQEGLTLRVVEALFFEKKLITNKLDIDTYDFYNPNNVYILGKRDENSLKDFINTPYEPVPNFIKNRYDFKYWVREYFE